jgi:hypothetical protein
MSIGTEAKIMQHMVTRTCSVLADLSNQWTKLRAIMELLVFLHRPQHKAVLEQYE